MDVVKYVLIIYSWALVGVLVFFLWCIAHFYEKTSGQRVPHYLFLFPALLLAAGVGWYLVYDVEFTGQPVGDLLLCAGGTLLLAFGIRLQELMTGERR